MFTFYQRTVRAGAPVVSLFPVLALFVSSTAAQTQWTQWGGPSRNFKVAGSTLADRWPESGPKRLWQRELGDGYATVLVDGEALYTMYRVGEDEFTIRLDAGSGKTRWEYKNQSPFTPLMAQFGPGPSSTPLLTGGRLYSIGTNMVFHCFDARTGEVQWKHDLVAEFGATVPGRGYSSSPIAYGDNIIVYVGGEGKTGQSVMAFNQKTGKVAWKNQSFGPTHSSPIVIRFGGRDQLVCFMAAELVGLDPTNGALLWRHPHATRFGANLSTPVWNGKDLLFCSAAYDSGSRVIRLKQEGDKTTTRELWFSKKMRLHHANPVQIGDYVYGSSGDFGPAFFVALNLETGDVAWQARGFSKATCVYADGKLIILDQDGNLALATVSPREMKVVSKATVARKTAWSAPTVVGDRLYIRDRKHISAFDIGAR